MESLQVNNVPNKPSAGMPHDFPASLPDGFAVELNHVISLINDEYYQCHVLSSGDLTVKQADDFLHHELLLNDPRQIRITNSEIAEKIQNSPDSGTVFSLPCSHHQKHIIIFFKKQTDDFELWRLLARALQEKWYYTEYFQQAEHTYWRLRQNGHSTDEAQALMKAAYFNYEKITKISNTYKTFQANVIGTAVTLITALQKHTFEEVSRIQDRLLTASAQRSNELFLPANGVSGLDFPVCKDISEQLLGGSHVAYIQKNGFINWKKLYEQTLTAVKHIGYTPHAIIDADKTECLLLQAMQKQYPKRQTLLNMLRWTKAYQGSKILQDFTQAQQFYLSRTNHR